jgi:hypothetical protein
MTLWLESDFRRTPVFPGLCLELNSEASVLEIYTGAWAEFGGKGTLPRAGLQGIPGEAGVVFVPDGDPRLVDGEAL